MDRLRVLPTGLLLLAGACAVVREPPQQREPAVQLPNAEQEVFDLINAHRESQRLPRLSHSSTIASVARAHSEAMAAGEAPFSHDGIDHRAALIARKLDFADLGENLVALHPASELRMWRPIAGWLESEGHRRTLEGCYDLTGVGVARDGRGAMYVTQIFVLQDPNRRCDSRPTTEWE